MEDNVLTLIGKNGEAVRIRESGLAQWVLSGYYTLQVAEVAKRGRPKKEES